MMKIKKNIDDTVIYQTKNGAIMLKQNASADMLWATQAHIADIFEIERSVATKHIRNILKNKELNADSVCAKLAHTAEDGKTYQVQFYSLDVILAAGYRTNSKKAIAFHQWATRTLKDHIYKGYTINKSRIQKNYAEFLKAIDDVKNLLPTDTTIDHDSILELVTLFADTWFSLDAYDKDKLVTQGITKKKVVLTAEKLNKALAESRAYTENQISLITQSQSKKYSLTTKIAEAAGLRAHELFTLLPKEERSASAHRQWSRQRFIGREGKIYTVTGKGGLTRANPPRNSKISRLREILTRKSNLFYVNEDLANISQDPSYFLQNTMRHLPVFFQKY